jgi:hypothetical protein
MKPRLSILDARHRVPFRRRLGNARQNRHFADVQLVQRLAEVHFRRRGDAVGPLAEEGLVGEQRKDVLLRELGFHQQRQVNLADLALQASFGVQEHVPGHLLGDRAAALAHATSPQVRKACTQNPLPINAMVTEEAVVLGGQEGLNELFRDLLVAHRYTPLLADRRDQAPVPGVDP